LAIGPSVTGQQDSTKEKLIGRKERMIHFLRSLISTRSTSYRVMRI